MLNRSSLSNAWLLKTVPSLPIFLKCTNFLENTSVYPQRQTLLFTEKQWNALEATHSGWVEFGNTDAAPLRDSLSSPLVPGKLQCYKICKIKQFKGSV